MSAGPAAGAGRHKIWVIVAAGVGTALGFLDQTIIGVALPTIGDDLGMSETERAWVVQAYLVPLAALAVALGVVGSRIGMRPLFTAGVLVFCAGSIACGVSDSGGMLIASRAIQGVGAAAMFTAGQAMVASSFKKEHRGAGIGGFVAVTTLALSTGPLIGGFLVDAIGWRSVFFVNPIIAIATVPYLVGWARALEGEGPAEHPRSLDLRGFALFVPGMLLAIAAITEVGRTGWTGTVTVLTVAAIVALVGFVWAERHTLSPLLRLELLRNPTIAAAIVSTVVIGFVQMWGVIALPAFLQEDLGMSALAAGAGLLPLTIALTAGQPLAGRMTDRGGPRLPTLIGLPAAGIALLVTAPLLSLDAYAPLAIIFLILGLGLALAQTPLNAAAMNVVDAPTRVEVSGLLGTARQTAALFGLAILTAVGALFSSGHATGSGNEVTSAIQVGLVVGGIVLLAGLAWCARLLSQIRPEEGAAAPSS